MTNEGGSTVQTISVSVPSAVAEALVTVLPAVGGTVRVSMEADWDNPYPRCWKTDDGFAALLARQGVKVRAEAVAHGADAIRDIEIQESRTTEDTAWSTVGPTESFPDAPEANHVFSLMIDQPIGGATDPLSLLPRDQSLSGKVFRYRAVARFRSGEIVSSEPVSVLIKFPGFRATFTGQTLPPTGPAAQWFSQSAVETYETLQLIP